MKEAIVFYLPWLLSVVTIWMTLMAGNKTRWAWAIGLCNQALWATWIIASQSWGLVPMCIALTIVYARNHIKWAQLAVANAPMTKAQYDAMQARKSAIRNQSVAIQREDGE